MEGFTCFTVRWVFMVSFGREGTGDGDSPGASESVGSGQSQCQPERVVKLEWGVI